MTDPFDRYPLAPPRHIQQLRQEPITPPVSDSTQDTHQADQLLTAARDYTRAHAEFIQASGFLNATREDLARAEARFEEATLRLNATRAALERSQHAADPA